MPEVVTGAFTLGAALLGFLSSQASKWWDARVMQESREQERSRARGDFQRETLIAFQRELARLGRAHGAAHHADTMARRKTGKVTLLPEGLSDEILRAGTDCRLLVERILDDDVRRLYADFNTHVSQFTHMLSEEAADAYFLDSARRLQAVHERVGVVLRTYL